MIIQAYDFQRDCRSMSSRLLWLLIVAAVSLQIEPNDPRRGSSSAASSELATFHDLMNSPVWLQTRALRNRVTIFSYAFENSDVQYNVSVDVSGCGTSVKRSTIAGIYTHANGTVQNVATVGDILEDLKSIENDAPNAQDGQIRLANHTMTFAQSLETSSNELLDNVLICKDSGEVVHDELRHLLRSWSRVEKFFLEHTVLLVSSVAAAALGGGTTLLGGVCNLSPPRMDPSYLAAQKRCVDAGLEEDKLGRLLQEELDLIHKLRANGTDWREALERAQDLQHQQYEAKKLKKELCSQAASSMNATVDKFVTDQDHYRSATSQARKSAIITATTVFAATLSAGLVNDLAVRRRMHYAEALPANLYLSLMRRVQQLYSEVRAREASWMAV